MIAEHPTVERPNFGTPVGLGTTGRVERAITELAISPDISTSLNVVSFQIAAEKADSATARIVNTPHPARCRPAKKSIVVRRSSRYHL